MYFIIRVQFPPKCRIRGEETGWENVTRFSNVPKGPGGQRRGKTSGTNCYRIRVTILIGILKLEEHIVS